MTCVISTDKLIGALYIGGACVDNSTALPVRAGHCVAVSERLQMKCLELSGLLTQNCSNIFLFLVGLSFTLFL